MILKKMLPALLMSLAFSANAEVPLTASNILGSWTVDKESINRNGSNSKALKTVWTFKSDGIMVGVSKDSQAHARMEEVRATLNYRIENGKMIKQVSPGRSREQTCTAEEKEGPKMILKCGNIYFFMTKK